MHLRRVFFCFGLFVQLGRFATAGELGEPPQLVFGGYVVLGPEKEYVSVSLSGRPPRWIAVGAEYEGYRVVRLDIPGEKLIVAKKSGAELGLPLQVAAIKDVSSTAMPSNRVRIPFSTNASTNQKPLKESEIVDIFPPKGTVPRTDDLDWEWIESSANPMRWMATVPSQTETRRWGSMPQADRDAVVELYRQGGWALTVFVKRNGLVAASYRKIKRPE